MDLARDAGQSDLFDRATAVATAEPVPNFLHSALCAMSPPVRQPADDRAPIIRQDGHYTLVITPKGVVERADGGQQRIVVLGVPYGSLPRLVLIHIMTEAVRTKSRHVVLGASFTDWMRRMGFRTISYGPRGSATLVRQQLDSAPGLRMDDPMGQRCGPGRKGVHDKGDQANQSICGR